MLRRDDAAQHDWPCCAGGTNDRGEPQGVEQYVIDGVTIRVCSVAKSVADCCKFHDIVGLDVAVEALPRSREDSGYALIVRPACDDPV